MCFFEPEPEQPPACVSEVKGRVHLFGIKSKKKGEGVTIARKTSEITMHKYEKLQIYLKRITESAREKKTEHENV